MSQKYRKQHMISRHNCTYLCLLIICCFLYFWDTTRWAPWIYSSTFSLISVLRWWWVAIATPRPFYPRRRDPVPIVQETGWGPGQVLTGAEKLAAIVIQSPDRPARSESLYRLSYPGPRSRSNVELQSTDYFTVLFVGFAWAPLILWLLFSFI